MLQIVIDTVRKTEVNNVIVVLGAGSSKVRREVDLGREKVVVNSAYGGGMSTSVRVGLSEALNADAALIVLGDQPFVAPETLDALIHSYRRSGSPIVVPVYHGRRGNPVLFDRRFFREIMQVTGDAGAKAVVQAHPSEVLELPVDDEGVVIDIDSPSDYDRLQP